MAKEAPTKIEIKEIEYLAMELYDFNEFCRWFKRFLMYASVGGFITTAVYIAAKILRLF